MSLFIMMSELALSVTTTTTTQTVEVTREDPGGSPPFSNCPFKGVGCTLRSTTTTTTTTPIIPSPNEGYFVLNANVGPIVGQIGTNQFSVSDRSLEFPIGTFLTIIHSDEYPQLDNTVIPLAGITTNSTGDYTVTF